ncbi:RadC family protein [Halopseudomonas pelagia]|uniref:RadC family protein n=1 Tax=Halopseudomonas pelagia TaxID=553151 RepID=UPI0030D8428F|tara:strand:- start:808 stop:1305 length:498 start_codon:yes stop_codon:yes gene_type:complete
MSTLVAVQDSTNQFTMLEAQHDDWIIARAMEILEHRVFSDGTPLLTACAVKNFLRAKLVDKPNEVFAVLFLNNQHRVIAYEELFRGTIDAAMVYPRVVLSETLKHNAAAVIFVHNHPSGDSNPSHADRQLTTRLKTVLELVDVRVLDHFIIGKGQPYSFAEQGLL